MGDGVTFALMGEMMNEEYQHICLVCGYPLDDCDCDNVQSDDDEEVDLEELM